MHWLEVITKVERCRRFTNTVKARIVRFFTEPKKLLGLHRVLIARDLIEMHAQANATLKPQRKAASNSISTIQADRVTSQFLSNIPAPAWPASRKLDRPR